MVSTAPTTPLDTLAVVDTRCATAAASAQRHARAAEWYAAQAAISTGARAVAAAARAQDHAEAAAIAARLAAGAAAQVASTAGLPPIGAAWIVPTLLTPPTPTAYTADSAAAQAAAQRAADQARQAAQRAAYYAARLA